MSEVRTWWIEKKVYKDMLHIRIKGPDVDGELAVVEARKYNELKEKLDLAVKALNDINSHQNCRDSFDICREALKKIMGE